MKLNLQNIEGVEVLTRAQLKNVLGGVEDGGTNYCGKKESNGCCNVYCGEGSGVTCSGTCGSCVNAGNGQNPNVPGGDKLCAQHPEV